jgi:cold shock CspA family protein
MRGTVIFYSPGGYGFIAPDDGGDDIYFGWHEIIDRHCNLNCYDTGARVTFHDAPADGYEGRKVARRVQLHWDSWDAAPGSTYEVRGQVRTVRRVPNF